jgi:hypothetical protein
MNDNKGPKLDNLDTMSWRDIVLGIVPALWADETFGRGQLKHNEAVWRLADEYPDAGKWLAELVAAIERCPGCPAELASALRRFCPYLSPLSHTKLLVLIGDVHGAKLGAPRQATGGPRHE